MAKYISLNYETDVNRYTEVVIKAESITYITENRIYSNNGAVYHRNAWQIIEIVKALLAEEDVVCLYEDGNTGYVVHKDCPC